MQCSWNQILRSRITIVYHLDLSMASILTGIIWKSNVLHIHISLNNLALFCYNDHSKYLDPAPASSSKYYSLII